MLDLIGQKVEFCSEKHFQQISDESGIYRPCQTSKS